MYHKSTIQLNQLNSSVGRTYIFADFQSKSYHIKYNTKTKLIEPTNTVELILFKISHWRCSFATFYGLSAPKSSILHNFLLKIIQRDLIKYLLYLFLLPTNTLLLVSALIFSLSVMSQQTETVSVSLSMTSVITFLFSIMSWIRSIAVPHVFTAELLLLYNLLVRFYRSESLL